VHPSPVYIELAEKIASWNATWSAGTENTSGIPGGWTADKTGVFGYWYQLRGRAWGLRSLAHATFLAPEGSAWKSGVQSWIDANRQYLEGWYASGSMLNVMWDGSPLAPIDHG
jgi:hypothetical protein